MLSVTHACREMKELLNFPPQDKLRILCDQVKRPHHTQRNGESNGVLVFAGARSEGGDKAGIQL